MDRVDPTDVRLCLEANRNCGLSVDGVLRPSIAAAATGRSSLRRGVGWPPSPRSQRVLPRLTDRRLFVSHYSDWRRLARRFNKSCAPRLYCESPMPKAATRLSLRVKPRISLSSVPVSRNRLSSSRLQDTGYKTLADW